jgi:OOP family OmpA-OmpF porin
MKKTMLAAGVALGFAVAGITSSAVAEVPITLNAGMAQWYFDSDTNLRNTSTPWVGLEWAFNDKWAAEIAYFDDEAENDNGSNPAGRGIDTDVSMATLGMKYYAGSYIDNSWRVRPYAALAVGMLSLDPQASGTDSDDDTTINGGLGVRAMFGSRFSASLDWRAVYDTDSEYTSSIASLGLNYYFGNVTPKAQPVEAPLDSDGDGVPDSLDQCPGTPAGTRVDEKGCPLPVARVASIKLKVNFAFDSTVVQEKYFTDLGELAKFLERFNEVDVKIDGYTDSVGPDDYNQQLSQRRAQAVVDTLVKQHGIDASRLQAVGYGEADPVASNDTAEGRAENRRVMASLEVKYDD